MLKNALESQLINQLSDTLRSPPSLGDYSDLFLTKESQIDLLKQRQATLIKQNEHCRASYENALSVVHDAHAAWINITNKNNGFGSLRETLVLIDQLRERLDICIKSLSPIEDVIVAMSEQVREKQQKSFISLKEKEVSDFKIQCDKEYSVKHEQILEKRQQLLEQCEKERMKKCEQLEQKAKSEIEEYRKSGKVSRLLPETENCDLFNESDALDTAQSNDELFSNVPSSDGWELDDEGEYAETSCGQQQAKDKTKITHKLVTEIEPE